MPKVKITIKDGTTVKGSIPSDAAFIDTLERGKPYGVYFIDEGFREQYIGNYLPDSTQVKDPSIPPPPPPACPPGTHLENGVCVPDVVIPPPPTPAGLIYDSAIHSKLHDGIVRTVTSEGDMECRASGNPKIRVNADKTFSLVSGSGTTDNFSVKVRSRHNESDPTTNRFGGVGSATSRSDVQMKIEKYHNEHESGVTKNLPKSIQTGQYVKKRFTCKDVSGGIYQLTEIDYNDGQGYRKVNESTFSNPPSYYKNKALYDQKSYLWLRLNNSDHGRIYLYKNNYNCRLEVEFKFDSGNSITFKSVKLFAI